jgi:TetR/AcrR family transcriptional regulator, transcriptional repressor for nem operon
MGRSSARVKEETRGRLLAAAGRGFRMHGFGGVGVDGVAKDAGVTSGAFYVHFGSKAEIFRAALAKGLDDLRGGLGVFQQKYGAGWLRRFVLWYLNDERRADLPGSCALATLTLEAARADAATRELYDEHLRAIAKALQAGLGGSRREADAWAILALLSGGMSMAHAAKDPKLGARIARSVANAVIAIGEAEPRPR